MSQTLMTFRLFCPPSLEMEISRNLFSVGYSEIRLPEAKILLKGRCNKYDLDHLDDKYEACSLLSTTYFFFV